MYKSNCYNYDWFVDWLRQNLTHNPIPQNLLSAELISKHFTRLYFDVTVDDVIHAMEELGYSGVIKQGETFYSVSYSEKVEKALWETWK